MTLYSHVFFPCEIARRVGACLDAHIYVICTMEGVYKEEDEWKHVFAFVYVAVTEEREEEDDE